MYFSLGGAHKSVLWLHVQHSRVLFSVVHRRKRFEVDTAIMRQSVLLSSGQQFVDRIC